MSPDIALTTGIRVGRQSLLFLLVFGLTVALGLRFLGVLLMGSLVIIPAATARRMAADLSGMLAWSVGLATLSMGIGTALAAHLGRPGGPFVIVVASALFFASFLVRRKD